MSTTKKSKFLKHWNFEPLKTQNFEAAKLNRFTVDEKAMSLPVRLTTALLIIYKVIHLAEHTSCIFSITV